VHREKTDIHSPLLNETRGKKITNTAGDESVTVLQQELEVARAGKKEAERLAGLREQEMKDRLDKLHGDVNRANQRTNDEVGQIRREKEDAEKVAREDQKALVTRIGELEKVLEASNNTSAILQRQKAKSDADKLRSDNSAKDLQKKLSILTRDKEALFNANEQKRKAILVLENELHEKNRNIEQRIAQIQAHAFHIDSGVNPVNEDSYYVSQFNEIKVDLETWVASSTPNAAATLSKAQETSLLQIISTLGPGAKPTFDALKLYSRSWYKNPTVRVQMIRHIAALFVYERVFQPFVFALKAEFSRFLANIEADILSNGWPFGLLM
jgi:hypothetical protein